MILEKNYPPCCLWKNSNIQSENEFDKIFDSHWDIYHFENGDNDDHNDDEPVFCDGTIPNDIDCDGVDDGPDYTGF